MGSNPDISKKKFNGRHKQKSGQRTQAHQEKITFPPLDIFIEWFSSPRWHACSPSIILSKYLNSRISVERDPQEDHLSIL
jgi:hypothetical protein